MKEDMTLERCIRFSPILISDFGSLPPTISIIAEIDPVRDDALGKMSENYEVILNSE